MESTDKHKETAAEPLSLMDQLERNARLCPDTIAIVHKETKITYKDFCSLSNALGNCLLEMGLQKGDRVGILLEKNPEAIISFPGIASAGGIAFPVDYLQLIENLQFVIDLTQPFTLIVGEKFLPLLSSLRLPFRKERLIVVGEQEALGDFVSWEKATTCRSSRPRVETGVEDIAYLNFTTGTTGTPKGAVTTHANIYWNTRSAVESLKLRHDDIHLCMFPVFVHPHEIFARALYLGGTMILIDTIYPKSIAKAVADHGVTCMMAIASIYEALTRSHEITALDLSSLRIAESGGMHVSADLMERFRKSFGKSIVPVWGSTETAGISLAAPVDGPHRPGSMGKPCPYYEVKVIREDGTELPPEEEGEMIIRGPAVCDGYFNRPEETARFMRDGWFYTGDMVKRDRHNNFYFMDRKARMLKVGGMKVFPMEIEQVLLGHPNISEAAVVSLQDRLHGEIPKAIIVTKNGFPEDKKAIRKFCEGRLPKYKIPRIIEFREGLPKSPGGKVLWRQL